MGTSVRADIAYPASGPRRLRGARDPVDPHVIVLFGATGDLSRRKILPGLTHLALSDLTPDIQVVGSSLDDLDDEAFRQFAFKAVQEFSSRPISQEQWDEFAPKLVYVPQGAGPEALRRGGGGGGEGGGGGGGPRPPHPPRPRA